jgi:hypothetical protein
MASLCPAVDCGELMMMMMSKNHDGRDFIINSLSKSPLLGYRLLYGYEDLGTINISHL